MTDATENDLGPLTWVKSEIDQALSRALEAIEQAASSEDERSSRLQFAQSHLHQARGALSIIGLDGLTQFTDGLDKLLGELAREEIALSEAVADVCRRSIAATGNYLDELSHGAPDQPLRLAQLHARIAMARGAEPPAEGDLFFPDLGTRIPRRPTPDVLDTAEEMRLLRAMRIRFQQGLLTWMRKADDPTGARMMCEAVAGIESRQHQQQARAFWLSAAAFCEVLAEGHVPVSPHIRRLCGRLDTQIRRLLAGNNQFPERLHRDTMYVVARAPAASPLVKALHSLYQLRTLLPPPNSTVSELPLAPLLTELRDQLNQAKEAWNQFAEGTAAALPAFEGRMTALANASRKLGRPAFVRLMTTLSAFAQWLRKDPLRLSDAISMEVASALLLADHALDSGRVPDASFSTQVEDTIARIEACSRGEAVAPHEAGASARQAQERSATVQLCKEMQASLAQIEQTLDAFFRAPEKRDGLDAVRKPVQQIESILTLLGESDAHDTLSDCDAMIAQLADPAQTPDTALFEPLADLLSALGFYIDSLARGRPERHHLTGESDADALPPAASAPTAPEAPPVAEPAPEPPATAPEADTAAPAQDAIVEHEEDIPDAPLPVPAPSEEAAQLLTASEEEIDAELLDIFIEEAREVLAHIATHLNTSRNDPGDPEALTIIRRGYHTLKGSGRMVGLNALGEVAWALEQTLNRWLQLDWAPNDALHALIGDSHALFDAWVEQLAGGGPTTRTDTAALVAEAERLLGVDAPANAAAPAPDTADVAEPTPEAGTGTGTDAAPDDSAVEPGGDDFDLSDLEATDLSMPAIPSLDFDEAPLYDPLAEQTRIEALELLESPIDDDTPLEPAPADARPTFDLDTAGFEPAENLVDAAPPTDAAAPGMALDLSADDGIDALAEAPEAVSADADAMAAPAEPEAPAADAPPDAPPEEHLPDTLQVGTVTLSRPLYELYQTEARQHLDILRHDAAQLRVNPTRIPQDDALRAAHTLAGISGTAGFDSVQRLGRALEHALARLIDARTPPSAEQSALLVTASDTLDAMLSEISHASLPLPTPVLEAQLDSVAHAPLDTADDTPAAIEPTRTSDDVEAAEPAPAPEAPIDTTPAADTAAPVEMLDVRDDIDEQLLPIFLEESRELHQEINARLREWRDAPDSTELHTAIARLLHTAKGSARMTGAMTLGEHLHAIEGRLEAASVATPTLLDELEQGIDVATQYIDRLAHGDAGEAPAAESTPTAEPPDAVATPAVAIDADEAAAASAATLRVRAGLVDRFVNEAGEIGIARTRIEGELRTQRRALLDLTENVIRLRNQLREVEIQADIQMQSRMAQAESEHADFDPLEMDRYTRLQELTRMMAESVNDVTTVQHALLRNLDGADAALTAQGRQTRALQQALMSVRMTPFDSLADRLYRVVRQSAKDLGKRANLDLRGGRIELDRSVLERITGPLEHLLRNAVAHGIESPEERHAARKPEIGEITLTVRHEGNEVVVEMRDDGAGLDYARIEQRARDNGLLDAGEVADERRLTQMIFLPGLSTAGNLSTVSGRGVGMDVVKSETAAVGGRIEVTSSAGNGATFRLYLPLTLAVTQALLVRAGGRTWAIPSNMVAQVMELKPDALATLREAGGTDWQDTHYRYTYLPHLLGDPAAQPEVHRFNWVLLLRSGTQTLAVHVDALRGNQEIVVKKAGPQLARLVGYAGATVLGDGEIVLIINPVTLDGLHEAGGAGGATAATTPLAPVAHVPTVMVVDDSLTVRKITGRLLEREGFEVVVAKDGVDALEQLLERVPDVILSDIEMPRMDGFDLARNIRNDERLKTVPIIMITSRLADKHREYARKIGVEHYLGKPYQEDELLGLIRRYTTPA